MSFEAEPFLFGSPYPPNSDWKKPLRLSGTAGTSSLVSVSFPFGAFEFDNISAAFTSYSFEAGTDPLLRFFMSRDDEVLLQLLISLSSVAIANAPCGAVGAALGSGSGNPRLPRPIIIGYCGKSKSEFGLNAS